MKGDAADRRVVVVAHPDDEILWLSSAVATAARIVFCFGPVHARPRLSSARRRAVAALPLPATLDLALPESGAGFSVDRSGVRPTACGLAIADAAARRRYEANYPRLLGKLREAVAGSGVVLTHNPWGEYGHAEHVQVYRALRTLQPELGFTLRFSNYFGALSWSYACRVCAWERWSGRETVRADRVLARRLMRVYRRAGAWTWSPFHRWPATETIYEQLPRPDDAATRPFAGELLRDVAALRPWPTPWCPARRLLRPDPPALPPA